MVSWLEMASEELKALDSVAQSLGCILQGGGENVAVGASVNVKVFVYVLV